MPPRKKKDGEYSSAISRFLPQGESDPSDEGEKSQSSDSKKPQSSENTKAQSHNRKIVPNSDLTKSQSHKRTKEKADGAAEEAPPSIALLLADDTQEKVRITAPYVNSSVNALFEETWMRLRRETGQKISQSEIIEAALAIVCGEFEEDKTESALYEAIRHRRGLG